MSLEYLFTQSSRRCSYSFIKIPVKKVELSVEASHAVLVPSSTVYRPTYEYIVSNIKVSSYCLAYSLALRGKIRLRDEHSE
jgi:hypothetical protein